MIALLIAALAVTAGTAPVTAEAPSIDRYQQLLDDFVVVTSPEPLETRFDYLRLHSAKGRYERLARIRRDLLAVSPKSMTPAERRAWAINTYNFLVIEAVTENLISTQVNKYQMAEGQFGTIQPTVQQIRINGARLFDAPLVEVGGITYSLDRFERTFVFDGFDHKAGGKPPASLDPRAHFALVCAAQGCPPLRREAYRAESLDVQLDRATRDALEHPSQLRWAADTRLVSASSLFGWYAADFGGPEGAYAFVRRHAPPALAAELERKNPPQIDITIPWNWKINLVPPRPRSANRDSTRG